MPGAPTLLVLTPTRELAQQIGAVCGTIAARTKHRIVTLVGGMPYPPQIKDLRTGVDVLIATPGRLIDLMEQNAVFLGKVSMVVLDEADRMLDMGFWPSVKKIIAKTPTTRQTLLFSATIDRAVMGSVGSILHDPAFVEIAHRGDVADTVEHFVIPTPQVDKPSLLADVLHAKGSSRVLVFTRTRSRADSCMKRLKRAGFATESIHSDRSQSQRRKALDNFSSGKTGVLVATDVLARGIDVTDVAYVVNFDLPTQAEDYIHRIGRTGRAGEAGSAISFVSPDQADVLRDIERLIKQKIPHMRIDATSRPAAQPLAAKAPEAKAPAAKQAATGRRAAYRPTGQAKAPDGHRQANQAKAPDSRRPTDQAIAPDSRRQANQDRTAPVKAANAYRPASQSQTASAKAPTAPAAAADKDQGNRPGNTSNNTSNSTRPRWRRRPRRVPVSA
jgi:ATP-dependent RNA helicase RhlE